MMRWIVGTLLILTPRLLLAGDPILISPDRAMIVSSSSDSKKTTIALLNPDTQKNLSTLVIDAGPEKISINDKTPLSIGPKAWAVVASKGHSNSSESFATYQVFAVINDRISLVYDGPFLYGIDADDGGTVQRIRFDTRFSALGTSTDGFKDILLKVTENRLDDLGKASKTAHTYQTVLHWSAAQGQYAGDIPELKRRVDQLWKKHNS
jgi:hypothetical protein